MSVKTMLDTRGDCGLKKEKEAPVSEEFICKQKRGYLCVCCIDSDLLFGPSRTHKSLKYHVGAQQGVLHESDKKQKTKTIFNDFQQAGEASAAHMASAFKVEFLSWVLFSSSANRPDICLTPIMLKECHCPFRTTHTHTLYLSAHGAWRPPPPPHSCLPPATEQPCLWTTLHIA